MKLTNKLLNTYIEIAGIVAKSPERFPGSKHDMIFYVDVKRKNKGVDTIPVIYDGRTLLVSSLPPVGSPIAVAGNLASQNDKDKKLIVYVAAIMMSAPPHEINANKVMLEGFICDKKQLHKTKGGKDVLTIIVAAESGNSKKNNYVPVVTWWKTAKFLDKAGIGTVVDIDGTLQTRKYYTMVGDTQVENIAYEVSATQVDVKSMEWIGER